MKSEIRSGRRVPLPIVLLLLIVFLPPPLPGKAGGEGEEMRVPFHLGLCCTDAGGLRPRHAFGTAGSGVAAVGRRRQRK